MVDHKKMQGVCKFWTKIMIYEIHHFRYIFIFYQKSDFSNEKSVNSVKKKVLIL